MTTVPEIEFGRVGLAGQVIDMPVSLIRRPIPSVLDGDKVCAIRDSILDVGQQVPIDVLEVSTAEGFKYFMFGGCHRWAAIQELQLDRVKVKVVGASRLQLMYYLGADAYSL
eukprot:ANDGO_06560.mRNA.1 Putative sulfiredoxin